MSLILNIDTSTEVAFVALALGDTIIGVHRNPVQKDHAAFLHPAIKNIMEASGRTFSELDAIAVTAGPGSYTGIRVGMATAKGLSFALNKPLITLSTLALLAHDAISNHGGEDSYLFCPMIDARRMEVYTAIYDNQKKEVLPPTALVIEENFYRKYSITNKLVLFGSGSVKCRGLQIFDDAIFIENVNVVQSMVTMSSNSYLSKSFTDLILSDPIYLKEFFNKVS